MKKIMYSAVALVAFSFAGMANTIEVEELKLTGPDACVMEGFAAAGAVQDMGGTPQQCVAAAEKAEKACRERSKVLTQAGN